MPRSNLLIALLFAVITGEALAQGVSAAPLTLICPYQPGSSSDQYLRTFALIAARYLSRQVNVENKPGDANTLGPATMARTARSDGQTLSLFPETVFRVPYLKK